MYQLVFLGLLSLAATTTAKHGTPRLHSHRDKGSAPDYSPSYGSGNVKQRKALVHDYWQDEVIDNFRDTAQKSHDDFVDYFRQLDKEHPA